MSGFGTGGGFNFGGAGGQQPNFSFGTPSNTTTSTATAAPTASVPPNVSFGLNPAPATSSGFAPVNFGGGLASGGAIPITPVVSQQQNPPLFSNTFAAPAAQSQPTNFTNAPVTSGTTGLAAPTAQSAVSFSSPSTGFQAPTLATTPATSGTTGFAATVPNTLFAGGLSASTAPVSAQTTVSTTQPISTAAGPSTTTTTTTPTGSTALTQLNFRQLQELINKWTIELGEQEKSFIEQATKVNAWDKTVMANGEKIAVLDETVSKVKSDHTRLEHTLDYLKTQQQEFEAFLEPLEASLPVNISAEPEREHLYTLSENMDTSLQQMAEDLKEIIRHINDSNKTVDKTDPVSQILKILNEHTDALQWVEDNSNGVKKSLEEVSKMHQMFRKDHERSLRMMFQH